MSSGVGQAILPIAGAAAGFVVGGPAGAVVGMQLGGAASGMLNSGSGGTTTTGAAGTSPQIVSGPGMGGNTVDSQNKTWGLPNVNAQMTPTTNAAKSASVPGSGSKSPGGTGSMGTGDYLSLGSTAMQAIAAAKAREQQKELTDAEIWKAKNPLAGQVVQGPNPSMVGTNMGGFPSVSGGFVKY